MPKAAKAAGGKLVASALPVPVASSKDELEAIRLDYLRYSATFMHLEEEKRRVKRLMDQTLKALSKASAQHEEREMVAAMRRANSKGKAAGGVAATMPAKISAKKSSILATPIMAGAFAPPAAAAAPKTAKVAKAGAPALIRVLAAGAPASASPAAASAPKSKKAATAGAAALLFSAHPAAASSAASAADAAAGLFAPKKITAKMLQAAAAERRGEKVRFGDELGWFGSCSEEELQALAAAAGLPTAGRDAVALAKGLGEAEESVRFKMWPSTNRGFFGPAGGEMRVRKADIGFTNPELKEECREAGLKVSGGRFELILRLLRAGMGTNHADDLVTMH